MPAPDNVKTFLLQQQDLSAIEITFTDGSSTRAVEIIKIFDDGLVYTFDNGKRRALAMFHAIQTIGGF